VCTSDSCDRAKGCLHPNNAIACDDGNACTAKDACASGTCAGTPINCEDGQSCTVDTCNTKTGCVRTAQTNGTSCVYRTNDYYTIMGACYQGVCIPPHGENGNACWTHSQGQWYRRDCSDTNPCTTDTCEWMTGCSHAANATACSDGKPCTTGDACAKQACAAGATVDPNDGNPCTADSCGSNGIVRTPVADGTACTGGKCYYGVCVQM